jgi:hypothetical protein
MKTIHNLLLFFQSNKNVKYDFSFQHWRNFSIAHPVSHQTLKMNHQTFILEVVCVTTLTLMAPVSSLQTYFAVSGMTLTA